VAERIAALPFAAIELPLSCPHTPGYGTLAGQSTPEATFEITSAVRRVTKKPLFIKVSPNVPAIAEVARAAEKAGADAITAVNSMGPGMLINIEARRPMLGFKMGGVTGPALRPIAVRCVYDILPGGENSDHRHRRRGDRARCDRDDDGRRDGGRRRQRGVRSRDRGLRPDRARDGRVDDGERNS